MSKHRITIHSNATMTLQEIAEELDMSVSAVNMDPPSRPRKTSRQRSRPSDAGDGRRVRRRQEGGGMEQLTPKKPSKTSKDYARNLGIHYRQLLRLGGEERVKSMAPEAREYFVGLAKKSSNKAA